ncbi:hypothetical protein LCGC14_2148950 [marine sediment metagenome]|uniref:Ornithine cyclodeaminase n=1 Tax=marine sediment metagenome TaxID=412755 RepID=A0A0F9EIB9_9ZZZZ
MIWTTLRHSKQQERLHDVHWMLKQMHTLLAMQRQGYTALGEEGYLSHPDEGFDRAITMSAWTAHPEEPVGILGSKWVASCLKNKERDLPRGRSVTTLNCAETGLPLLVFDGTDLSNARTAIFAIAAIELLHPHVDTIALVGAGRVHAWQAEYIRQRWPKASLWIYDPDDHRMLLFQKAYQAKLLRSWETALQCDVVSFATAGCEDGWVPRDAHFSAALWINTSLRDIMPRMVSRFQTVIVDDKRLAASQNTPYHLASLGHQVTNTWRLCDVAHRGMDTPVLINPAGLPHVPILVNPMGMALWDVGIGYMLLQEEYQAARQEVCDL